MLNAIGNNYADKYSYDQPYQEREKYIQWEWMTVAQYRLLSKVKHANQCVSCEWPTGLTLEMKPLSPDTR